MRKLYNEFFYIPKHGKIRETVMLARVAVSVAIVIACLAAISFSAYAYFSYNVTSGSNVIKAASFYTDCTVWITDESGNEVEVITSDHVSHLANDLKANKTYSVTLKHTELSTSQTGFVIVTATGCATRYHTQQLGRDGDGKTLTITFTITPGADTDVTFYSHWGTSSFYDLTEIEENGERQYILDGDDVKMTVDGKEPIDRSAGSEGSNAIADDVTTAPSTNTTTATDSTSAQTSESTTTSAGTTGKSTETTEPTVTETTTSTETAEDITPTVEATGTTTTEETE